MSTTYTGVVRRAGNRGYCWLHQDPPGDNRTAIYCHVNDIVGRKILLAGDRVSFQVEMCERGPRAANVKLLTPVRPGVVQS
jgi:cold shock CspA family protein